MASKMMRSVVASLCSLSFAGGLLAGATSAIAADDTWVSATGADTGACELTTPCRSLRYALAQTTAGGTITILTSGRYTPVRINKSVHIMAQGVEAVIRGSGSCGAVVCINAGANDVVSLRGVTITTDDPLKHGILFVSGGALNVDHCVIRAKAGSGLWFSPAVAARLFVSDSYFWGGGSPAMIAPSGGVQHVVFDRVHVDVGLNGLQFGAYGAAGSIVATVHDSTITPFAGAAIVVSTASGAVPIELMIDRAVMMNIGYGVNVVSGQNAQVRMGDSTLSGHDIHGVYDPDGSIVSYGTNKVVESVDGIPIPNVIPLK